MPSYKLKEHVRACVENETVVFLDLRADRYCSVPLSHAPNISGVADSGGGGPPAKLIERGLIEPAPEGAGLSVGRARAPAVALVPDDAIKLSFGDGAQVMAACVATARTLATRRLDVAMSRLAARKKHAPARSVSPERLAGVFEAVRPWYPRARVCLFDAFALMHFMLWAGAKPSLVIGVRTRPFAAHCWLEIDGKLACDASDYCPSFQPIAWI